MLIDAPTAPQIAAFAGDWLGRAVKMSIDFEAHPPGR
jgi:hypothetical protein